LGGIALGAGCTNVCTGTFQAAVMTLLTISIGGIQGVIVSGTGIMTELIFGGKDWICT
jgi:hypothetical protein